MFGIKVEQAVIELQVLIFIAWLFCTFSSIIYVFQADARYTYVVSTDCIFFYLMILWKVKQKGRGHIKQKRNQVLQ